MQAIEAIAHTLRGGTTIFFFAWAMALHRLRHRSRLMQLIFCGSLLLGFEYLKDALFLFPQFQGDPFWDNLVSLADLLCIPMACSFCIEAVSPGAATTRRLVPFLLLQLLCVLCYVLSPQHIVFQIAFILAFLQVIATAGFVIVFTVRYRRMLHDNYSSLERRDVLWIVQFSFAYFSLYLAYCMAFETTTWLSESIFCVLICLAWSFLYYYSCRHRVSYFSQNDEGEVAETETMKNENLMTIYKSPKQTAESTTGRVSQETKDSRDTDDETAVTDSPVTHTRLATVLELQMSVKKLYLDPSLTLSDLAAVLCTNRTTLTRCLNQELGSSFYDFVNRYRMEEACRLLAEAAERGETITMQQVSKQSGFNSVSSFNRYFSKFQGITPLNYYRQCRFHQD